MIIFFIWYIFNKMIKFICTRKWNTLNQKIGNFIKELRKQNNLTQKELADKYGVTYQAVSKWENGKNIPDISIIKQMSQDFNINIDNILDGNNKVNKKQYKKYLILTSIIIILTVGYIIFIHKDNFEFKTLGTTCNDFTVTGSIAYNKDKSSIYISNVNYCGEENNTKYDSIDCILYENNGNIIKKISEYSYNEDKITLNKFLNNINFIIDNYESTCKNYINNELYIEIHAYINNKITTYNIPLELNSCN